MFTDFNFAIEVLKAKRRSIFDNLPLLRKQLKRLKINPTPLTQNTRMAVEKEIATAELQKQELTTAIEFLSGEPDG